MAEAPKEKGGKAEKEGGKTRRRAKTGAKPVTLNGLPLKFSKLPTDLLLLYPPEVAQVFSSILSFGKVAR